ncbi:MAG: ComEC/Rec2 family competence protein, partial [Planctomycetia bacterium]|nr:ComEC/Rec2 family competence protein [Planctomycetia bacterium]
GQTAPGSVLSNLVAIPTMTFFVWACFGLLWCATLGLPEVLTHGCALCCEGARWILTTCLDLVSGIPGAFVRLPPPPLWWLIGFYLIMMVIVVLPVWSRRRMGRIPVSRGGAILLGWSLLGGVLIFTPTRPAGLEVQFLAVGHGHAALIRFPDDAQTPEDARGRTVLYDCGSFGDPEKIAERLFRASWTWRIRKIDTVIISHADADHYNAIPYLPDYFTIGEVVVGPLPLPDDDGTRTPLAELKGTGTLDRLRELRRTLESHRIPIRLVTEETELWEGMALRVFTEPELLSDSVPVRPTLSNANGLACLVTWAGRSLLLTGDVEGDGMASLVPQLPGHVEIVAAPHHGSVKSRSKELMDRVTPDAVVISCSAGDCREETMDFFRMYTERVWFTWRSGSLYGTGTRSGWRWSGWRCGKIW